MSAQMILSMWWHTTTEDRLRTFQMHFNFQTVASSLPSSDIEHCYHVILVFQERSRSSEAFHSLLFNWGGCYLPWKFLNTKDHFIKIKISPKYFPPRTYLWAWKYFSIELGELSVSDDAWWFIRLDPADSDPSPGVLLLTSILTSHQRWPPQ